MRLPYLHHPETVVEQGNYVLVTCLGVWGNFTSSVACFMVFDIRQERSGHSRLQMPFWPKPPVKLSTTHIPCSQEFCSCLSYCMLLLAHTPKQCVPRNHSLDSAAVSELLLSRSAVWQVLRLHFKPHCYAVTTNYCSCASVELFHCCEIF